MTLQAVFMIAILTIVGALFFVLQYFFSRRVEDRFSKVQQILRDEVGRFVDSANDRFMHEQTKSKAIFEQNKQSVEFHVEALNKELGKVTEMIQDIEKNRSRQFGTLEEKIAQAATATLGLSEVTQQLSSVIGNNQMRGQWGERMAEDILRAAGLEPGIHYLKNQAQDTVATRPDYTFLLPDQHKVYMDVKFPMSHFLEYAKAEDKATQDRAAVEFMRDVKNRIRELKKREYINPEEQTLDYVILFIPNEQIFSLIHRLEPSIMDEALSQKILLASPYSLYGVLSIIRQAYDNFYFRKSTNEILKLMKLFFDDYENFKKRFGDLGESLDKAKEKYLDIHDKSFKRLDQRVKKVEDFRRDQEKSLEIVADQESAADVLLAPQSRERIIHHG